MSTRPTVSIHEDSDIICQCASNKCKHAEQNGRISPINPQGHEVEINGNEKAFYFTCSKCNSKTKVFVTARQKKGKLCIRWRPEIPKPSKIREKNISNEFEPVEHTTMDWSKTRIRVRING